MRLIDSLETWKAASPGERERAARQLALPAGFGFDAIRSFALGGACHEIAQFRRGDALFSLVPGGPACLGFDAWAWQPTPPMVESWQGTAREYELDDSLAAYVAARVDKPRTAQMPAMLVQTEAVEVGWTPVDPAREDVQALLRQFPTGVTQRAERALRVIVTPDGRVSAEEGCESDLTHAGLLHAWQAEGFRLPSADEWEYLCGAGARTLWRWSDTVPCDRYPTDISPEEAAWRRQWVLSSGTLERPVNGFTSDWNLHRQPNAFGLAIAVNPYQLELTDRPGHTRGGDGGASICGGAGFVAGWLPLASAWRDPDACEHSAEDGPEIALGYSVARRVLALA